MFSALQYFLKNLSASCLPEPHELTEWLQSASQTYDQDWCPQASGHTLSRLQGPQQLGLYILRTRGGWVVLQQPDLCACAHHNGGKHGEVTDL